ncbi:MAG: hypothetical protein JWM64_909 [Frankiales bacterium]|nr:hypothetical protein [Frankiales bacterium]
MKNSLVRLLAAGLLVAVGIAGCGSSSTPSTKAVDAAATQKPAAAPATVSAAGASAFKRLTGLDAATGPLTEAELQTRVAKLSAKPTQILQTTPVSKKATPGKRIVYLACGVPICSEVANSYEAAAKKIGWKMTRVPLGVSPLAYDQAFTRAAALKPDLVVASGLNRGIIAKGLLALKKAGVPSIQWAAGITPEPGEAVYTMTDIDNHEAQGVIASEYLALDAKQKANVVIYNVPAFSITTAIGKTVKGYLPTICPDCKTEYKEVAVTDIGKVGQQATAYVQQHPETTHVFCTNGAFCTGVGQALKAAGQAKVKVVTAELATTNLQNIQNGTEEAGIALPLTALGWQLVDQSQRIFNGDDLAETHLVPAQMVTSVEDPSDSTIGAPADFEAQYLKLWQQP